MIQGPDSTRWQEIGWNSLSMQIPASWEPTVIYPDYLFFEQQGRAVFEIKWQQTSGRYSPERSMDQLRKTLKDDTGFRSWDIPSGFRHLFQPRSVSGFELQHEQSRSKGLILYCPACKRVSLIQWYFDTGSNTKLLENIFRSLEDHTEEDRQIWSIYDIKALMPRVSELNSHEFLPGRYTICFAINGLSVTLYRFKPAAILLQKKTLGQFGTELLTRKPIEEGNGWSSWLHKAEGTELLLAKLRRKPVFYWMRLWHVAEQNVILGVKAEGKRIVETGFLNNICENYTSL